MERRASITWAQRLKCVFNVDIEICRACGGAVRVVVCIEDPVVIERILAHLKGKDHIKEAGPVTREPPACVQRTGR